MRKGLNYGVIIQATPMVQSIKNIFSYIAANLAFKTQLSLHPSFALIHFVFFVKNILEITLVVIQSYESEADNEYVIRGNSVVMKCEIPSYVADFVFVDLWLDSEGRNYYPDNAEETGTLSIYRVVLFP